MEKNLTQWKKPLLLDQQDDIQYLANDSSDKIKGGKRSASQVCNANAVPEAVLNS